MAADRTTSGIIFNIQKFSLNDGPGIRTIVFFKGCPLHCRWCSNPESQSARIQVLWDSRKCVGCHHCIETCPAHAVSLAGSHIHIDYDQCSGCLKCVRECPGHALQAEGQRKTVQEVLDVCLQDLPFYEESHGGVTLSGGEMLAQPVFAKALYQALKEEGIDTACETTGCASAEVFADVTKDVDHLLFDMKHWDAAKHQEYTGVTNELPLLNMKNAIAAGKDVLPRIPVIPGFNDSLEDAQKLAERLQEVGAHRCQLLPFHQFGEGKYDMMDLDYAYRSVPNMHAEEIEDYRQIFIKNGIDAFF